MQHEGKPSGRLRDGRHDKHVSHVELGKAVHRLLLHSLLIVDFVYSSRLYRAISPGTLQPLCLGICAAVVAFYSVYLMLRGRMLPSVLAACFIALIFNQMAVFAGRISIAVVPNIFFQYVWLLTFVPFAGLCLAGQRRYLLNCVAWYGAVYCGFYMLASLSQMAGIIPGSILAALISSDVERGARVFIYTGLACFSYFYWLVQYRGKRELRDALLLAVCASASLLSLSRMYILIVFCLTMLFLFQSRAQYLANLTRGFLFAGSLYVLSGMVDTSFNPFSVFGSDSSGSYRAFEYEIVRRFVTADPVWGFGIIPASHLAKPFLGNSAIFASDLGPLGVWFDLGICGLVMSWIVYWQCTRPNRHLSYEYGWPLFLTGLMMTAIGCMSPLAITEAGATISGLIIGLAMAGAGGNVRRRRSGIAAPQSVQAVAEAPLGGVSITSPGNGVS